MRRIELPMEEIVGRYRSGERSADIAKSFGVKQLLIQRRLKSAGAIKPRGWSSKKYSVDETYFDVIDTEQKAYWLGIFLTDGSTSGGVRLNLQSRDEEHIKKFQRDIGSNHPIRQVDEGRGGTSCLHIGNKHLVEVLRGKGIVPHNKTIYNVPPSLERHYWRGAVDGDGHLGRNDIRLVGTWNICAAFKRFCRKYVSTKAKVRRREDKNVCEFRLHGCIANDVANVLYSDAEVYLNRKYEIWSEIIDPSRDAQSHFVRWHH